MIKDMEKACKDAKLACEMQIQFDSSGGDYLETPERDILQWIKNVKNLCK